MKEIDNTECSLQHGVNVLLPCIHIIPFPIQVHSLIIYDPTEYVYSLGGGYSIKSHLDPSVPLRVIFCDNKVGMPFPVHLSSSCRGCGLLDEEGMNISLINTYIIIHKVHETVKLYIRAA